jgi:hypothetical protein
VSDLRGIKIKLAFTEVVFLKMISEAESGAPDA